MSEENVESSRRVLDAFNRRDRAAWLALCDQELEDIPPRNWPESRRTQGREAVWDLYVKNTALWETAQFQYVGLDEGGKDMTVCDGVVATAFYDSPCYGSATGFGQILHRQAWSR